MSVKTILVTGATDGLGLQTATVLAALGHRVALHGRSEAKGRAALAAIRKEYPSADVRFYRADFFSLQQVRSLAGQIQSELPRLDVLINNAGCSFITRVETADGYEATFAVNHLAPFLLTNLVLDKLQASAPARIVNVASAAHRYGLLDFDDLMSKRRYGVMRVYGSSKLANILFTRELAKRLAGTSVTVNALHPGVVRTHIGQYNWFSQLIGHLVMRAIAIPVEEGAKTSLFLATANDVEGQSGGYYKECTAITPKPHALDDSSAARLWEASERLVGLAA
jgi:NAD(P)-dependent dehydrogenase (short-subunit alcohol dehydrogenase family)